MVVGCVPVSVHVYLHLVATKTCYSTSVNTYNIARLKRFDSTETFILSETLCTVGILSWLN